jgi:chromate reductase
MTPRILAFAGSTRGESFNKKLVQIAVKGARGAGADLTLLDLEDFPLPLFDQDLEAEHGMPDNGTKLKRLFIDHDGLLVASPEYNSSITAVLKNAIDWLSRPAPGEHPWWLSGARSPP